MGNVLKLANERMRSINKTQQSHRFFSTPNSHADHRMTSGGRTDESMPPEEAISVVLVEDDDRLARLTARYLESHGVVVTIAADGREAIT